jgi:hypothetical protein
MQQITLTVIMEKDDGHPVLLALQSFQGKSSSHRLTLPLRRPCGSAALVQPGFNRHLS